MYKRLNGVLKAFINKSVTDALLCAYQEYVNHK